MAIIAVRIRGTTLASKEVIDTLKMLNLTRANHCVIISDNPSTRGMLQKVQIYTTWGDATRELIAKLLVKRGQVAGGQKLTDAYIKENSKFSSIWDFAQAVAADKANMKDVKGLKPVLRLHPPIKGYKSVKLTYAEGGDLGDRGKEIESLVTRMVEGGT